MKRVRRRRTRNGCRGHAGCGGGAWSERFSLQENLTGASCGKGPDAVSGCPDATPCGEGADTEAGETPGVGASESAASSGVARRALPAAFRLARPTRRAQARRRAKAATPPKRDKLSLRPKSVSSRRTMRSPTCSTMFDVNPPIATSLSRTGGLSWGWCPGI